MQLPEDQVIGLSSTGVAGPDTLAGKAVGEVYLGISSRLGTKVFGEQFEGSRAQIRLAARDRALEILREELARF
jgi:nicotinamide mononucleotide (NMN) deamidase PncC